MIRIGVKYFLRSGLRIKTGLMNAERRTPNTERNSHPFISKAGTFKLFLLLIPLLLFPAACAHLSPGLQPENVAPLFHIQTDTEKQSSRLDAAGPFYSQSESPDERGWIFRPFFSYEENLKEKTQELDYFYPFGQYRKTPRGRYSRLSPFYSSFKPSAETEEEDKRENVDLLLVFWGKDKEGKPYGGFFPFGGLFRDRFAREEIDFVLWPFYSRILDEGAETYNVLWPIFSFTSGGGRSGFRIWPFYGQEKQEGMGAYQRFIFLWPIGFYEQKYLDTDNPKISFYLFPLYVSERSSNENKKIFLWPFFNFYTEKNFDYFQVDFPWPFIQFARGENALAVKLLPLFSYQKLDQRERINLLWPLFYQEKEETDEKDEVLNRFLYVTKFHQVYYKKEDRWERDSRFWPFFRYAEDGRGMVHFYFPALIPVDWEGLERHYGTLFRIFEYYQDGKDKEITKFLWGLYYHQKQKDMDRIEVSFLFTYVKEKESLQLSFLKGFLGYRRDGPKQELRILYIPISWEEKKETEVPPGSPPEE